MGFYTNYCIETTVRMAGNLGFDTYLVHDACAAINTLGHDGTYYEAIWFIICPLQVCMENFVLPYQKK